MLRGSNYFVIFTTEVRFEKPRLRRRPEKRLKDDKKDHFHQTIKFKIFYEVCKIRLKHRYS